MEFNLDNYCDNHNHYSIKVLGSLILYRTYNDKWGRNREYISKYWCYNAHIGKFLSILF
jgi:hypothetical protein